MNNMDKVMKLVSTSMNAINRRLAAHGVQIASVNVKGQKIERTIANSADNASDQDFFYVDASITVDENKIAKQGNVEALSIVYSMILEKAKQKSADEGRPIELFKNDSDQKENSKELNNKQPVQEKAQTKPRKKNLLIYIKEFLMKFFGIKKNTYEEAARAVVEDFENQNTPEDFNKIIDNMFAGDMTEVQDSKKLFSARAQKLTEKGDAAKEMGDETLSLMYYAQSSEVIDVQLKENFNKMKESKNGEFEQQQFVINYVAKCLKSYNIPINGSVIVTFEKDSTVGRFYNTNPKRINVDISKTNGSVTDLAMTIEHETKHCADSIHQEGLFENGEASRSSTLVGSLDLTDMKNIHENKNTKAYKLLQKVNSVCYRLDPNERSGRLGEVEALKYMSNLAKDDASLARDVKRNIKAFDGYQKTTIVVAQALTNDRHKDSLKSFVAQYEKLKQSGMPDDISEAIEKRIAYLKEIVEKGLDMSQEIESLHEPDTDMPQMC